MNAADRAATRSGRPLNSHPFAHRWNHNSHYYPRMAEALPRDAGIVVDVGCGDGTLARYLSRPGRQVLGVDVDLSAVPAESDEVAYVRASAEALPFATGSLDAVTMIMVLHHVDPIRALSEAQRVLRSGGVLALLGYGYSTTPLDWMREAADVLTHQLYARTTRRWDPPVRLADPTLSWTETRRLLESTLPGGHYRRLPMWRFAYRWTATDGASAQK